MKNKYIKLFIVAIITMFISIVPTYAREVKLEDSNERNTFGFIIGKEHSRVNYVYLIGEYAFTSDYKDLDLQDVMLAARSIKVTDNNKEGKLNTDGIFGEMTIYKFTPKISDGKITGWNTPKQIVGKTDLPEKFNVKYIDYNYVKEDELVDTDQMVNTAMDKLSTTLFDKVNDVQNDTVTINVKTDQLKQKVTQGMASGVFPMLNNLLKENNGKIESIDFAYDGIKLTLGKELDINKLVEWLKENCQKIFGKDLNNVILADLLDKEFTATINLGESDTKSYVSKNNGTTKETYTIKFTGTRQKVNTTNKAKTALGKLSNSDIFEFSDNDIKTEATVKIKKEKLDTTIADGMASGVLPVLESLVNDEDVESVEFAYTTEKGEEITYTLKKGFIKADLIKWFNDNCEKILGYPAGEAQTVDLINKSFTATINLKNYAVKENDDPEKYTIKFDGELPEVDSQTLVETLKNQSIVNKSFFEMDDERSENQNVTIKVKNIDTEIVQGMKSGVFAALHNIANQTGIQSVDFIYNGLSYSFTKNTDITSLAKWFSDHKKEIFGEKEHITLADLHNKKFSVTLNVGRVGKLKDPNKKTYEITLLKTHEVTFHDDKAKAPSKEKEVVSVYDNEPIPEEEVKKSSKRSTDVETDVFLGWYEEIIEGEDEENEFDFDTPITENMELDAHWGTKLSNEEKQKVTAATTSALEIINSHKESNLDITVKDKNIISIINNNTKGSNVRLIEILNGSGVKTALQKLLNTDKTNIQSITLSLGNEREYSKDITKNMVDNPFDFVEELDLLFTKKVEKSVYDATWGDITEYAKDLKVKVNYKDGKILDSDNNSEYSFELNNKA